MAESQWHLEVNGKKVGPFTLDHIKGLYEDGEIKGYHQVTSNQLEGKWISVQELIDSLSTGIPTSPGLETTNTAPPFPSSSAVDDESSIKLPEVEDTNETESTPDLPPMPTHLNDGPPVVHRGTYPSPEDEYLRKKKLTQTPRDISLRNTEVEGNTEVEANSEAEDSSSFSESPPAAPMPESELDTSSEMPTELPPETETESVDEVVLEEPSLEGTQEINMQQIPDLPDTTRQIEIPDFEEPAETPFAPLSSTPKPTPKIERSTRRPAEPKDDTAKENTDNYNLSFHPPPRPEEVFNLVAEPEDQNDGENNETKASPSATISPSENRESPSSNDAAVSMLTSLQLLKERQSTSKEPAAEPTLLLYTDHINHGTKKPFPIRLWVTAGFAGLILGILSIVIIKMVHHKPLQPPGSMTQIQNSQPNRAGNPHNSAPNRAPINGLSTVNVAPPPTAGFKLNGPNGKPRTLSIPPMNTGIHPPAEETRREEPRQDNPPPQPAQPENNNFAPNNAQAVQPQMAPQQMPQQVPQQLYDANGNPVPMVMPQPLPMAVDENGAPIGPNSDVSGSNVAPQVVNPGFQPAAEPGGVPPGQENGQQPQPIQPVQNPEQGAPGQPQQ